MLSSGFGLSPTSGNTRTPAPQDDPFKRKTLLSFSSSQEHEATLPLLSLTPQPTQPLPSVSETTALPGFVELDSLASDYHS